MTQTETVTALANLFEATGHAHHAAFSETDGADDNWAIWYAEYLRPRLRDLVGVDRVEQDIVAWLVRTEHERAARAADAPWPVYYARSFANAYAPEADETLALYYTPSCPYCQLVLRAIDALGVDIELRDVWREPRHREDLVAARGRATVPVLRCTTATVDRWMPESRDIVAYLQSRFG